MIVGNSIFHSRGLSGFRIQYFVSMAFQELKFSMAIVMTGSALFLVGCRMETIQAGSPAHKNLIAQDYQATADHSLPQVVRLSLDEALARAIAVNLDARVGAYEVLAAEDRIDLERLGAFPRFDFTQAFLGRSNEGASSSQSLRTGEQSLESSFSTDQYRRSRELSTNWNILDIALTALQVKIAGEESNIASQRYTKILQNIERDVYAAYWRARALQETDAQTSALIRQAENQQQKIANARRSGLISETRSNEIISSLLQNVEELKSEREQMALADTELKSLLSIPQNRKLDLTSAPKNYADLADNFIKADLGSLEAIALENRPEMLETIAQKNIDVRSIRREVIKTLPGASLALSLNNDSNSFLEDDRWMSFSGTIAQSLTSFITAPVRIRAAKNEQALNDQKRIALSAAIMAQVHIARHRLSFTRDIADNAYDYAKAQNALGQGKNQERTLDSHRAMSHF
jgi:outer membrane protein TolC